MGRGGLRGGNKGYREGEGRDKERGIIGEKDCTFGEYGCLVYFRAGGEEDLSRPSFLQSEV